MKIVFFLLTMLFTNMVFGQDKLSVYLDPKKPIMHETFNIIFQVTSENAQSIDDIQFRYPGLEIIGQTNQGVSTKTVYANGKLTVTRDIKIAYEMRAKNYGPKFLRDIKVNVDGKELTHPMISFEVLKEPQVKPEVFVMADIPKTDLFVGEGIVVRYYLYSKVSVSSLDVKKYPKLNYFLKRYLQEPDRAERVDIDGNLYIRNLIYAAKLFPEKTGRLKVDPLSMSVTYARINPNDPFNVFNSGRNTRSTTISSETVELVVHPLPTPIPLDFTGLIGDHDFSLSMNSNKLVVNQPLEMILTVTGPGALENLEAPKLVNNDSLEEFESNGELKISDINMASKIFSYTYLAKSPGSIDAKEITFSYLDPITATYKSSQVNMEKIEIGGQARVETRTDKTKKTAELPDPQRVNESKELILLENIGFSGWGHFLKFANYGLVIVSIVILCMIGLSKVKGFSFSKTTVPSEFKSSFEYNEFVHWMNPVISKEQKSPLQILKQMNISDEAKKYFIDLIESTNLQSYSDKKKAFNYKYNNKFFKEIARQLEIKNESRS